MEETRSVASMLFCNVLHRSPHAPIKYIESLTNKITFLEVNRYLPYLIEWTAPVAIDDGVTIKTEKFVQNSKEQEIRRVYFSKGKYRVGWVVDGDITTCMVCSNSFTWFEKYHCRVCGNIICGECSPYFADISVLSEDGGSRVCKPCFHNMIETYQDNLKKQGQEEVLDYTEIYKQHTAPSFGKKLLRADFDEEKDEILVFTDEDDFIIAADLEHIPRTPSTQTPTNSSFGAFDSDKRPTSFHFKNDDFNKQKYSRRKSTTDIDDDSFGSPPIDMQDADIVGVTTDDLVHAESTNLTFRTTLHETHDWTSNTTDTSFISSEDTPRGDNTTKSRLEKLRRKTVPVNVTYLARSAKQHTVEELVTLLISGSVASARRMIRAGCPVPDPDYATELLHATIDNIKKLEEVLGTFILLVESCHADVNSLDHDGSSPLMKLLKINQRQICGYLISRGADPLQEDSDGICPFFYGLDQGYEWMLSEFVLHQEDELFFSNNKIDIDKYVRTLLETGYAGKVSDLLEEKQITISPEEASVYYEKCKRNITRMKYSAGTLALLRRLGAGEREME